MEITDIQPATSRREWIFAIALVLLALCPTILWPGEVSWLIDEPRLVANAWHYNNSHGLADRGLFGNMGFPYGPLPTQIYQVLLMLTHDPFLFVLLRAILCAGVTCFSLLWLARTLGLPPWFVAGIAVAPFVTMYHRVLWDASFTIPIGALAVAAFASFVKTQRAHSLRICAAATVILPMIHPQALPLCVPLAGYLLWRHRTDFRRDGSRMLWTGIGVFSLHALYLIVVAGVFCYRIKHGVQATYPGIGSRSDSALAPFLGGNLLTGFDYAHEIASPGGPDWLTFAATWISRLIYPLIWIGILVSISRVSSVVRFWRSARENRPLPSQTTTRDIVTTVLLASLVLQLLLFTALRIPTAKQYYFGTFAMHATFAMVAIGTLRKFHIGTMLGGAFTIATAYITFGGSIAIHRHGYEAPGWPMLRDSVAIAREMKNFTDTEALTDIPLFQKYPQPIRTLRLLLPPAPAQPQRESGKLFVTYRKKDGKNTGEIILAELPADSERPANSTYFDIAPLPSDWVPEPSTW